jgi:3'(2'), 5'-bisphosphate nucleotidase
MNKALIENVKRLITEAGNIAIERKNIGLKIEFKGDSSPVTNADKEISDLIYGRLKALTPDIPVICEEQPITNIDTSRFWLVDPIDGTRSYIRLESSYTVNIGLIENNVPTHGFIYQPELEKLCYVDDVGTFKIEQQGNIVEASSRMVTDNYVATVSSHYLNLATRYFLKNHNITDIIRMPSSAKLCLVAEGLADIYPRFGRTMEWDIAAGHAVIRAAGGDIVDRHGITLNYGKPNFENPTFFACSKNWQAGHASSNNILDPKSY